MDLHQPAALDRAVLAVADAVHPTTSSTEIEAVLAQDPITTVAQTAGPQHHSPPLPDAIEKRKVKLIRDKDGRFDFVPGSRLINNLSWVVGFMELANAGDFAANVWNEVPVPLYAIILMAIGGTVAGVLCVFAFRDSRLAKKNVDFLRQQRQQQKEERARCVERGESTRDVDVYLAVTFRELGSEAIARWFMDLLMGCGAVLITIGTYMAIGGANEKVWLASNILSGYLGNAPIALYGLINSCWASFIFCKAQGHVNATRQPLRGSRAAALVKRRCRNVQVFCVINGTATTLGGVGSMLTAERWWGYVILAPVIVSSLFCNIWWRRRVGYTRTQEGAVYSARLEPATLVANLEFAARAEVGILQYPESPIDQFVADSTSFFEVLAFLEKHGLLDVYCRQIAANEDILSALGGNQGAESLTIGTEQLLEVPETLHPKLLDMAQKLVSERGPDHFRNRERYAAELLGTYYRIAGDVDFDGRESEKP